jgi:hypothetical protein
MALLGFVDKLHSRIQFILKKTSVREKKPQRHKGHRENAKLISYTYQTIDKRAILIVDVNRDGSIHAFYY